MLVRRGVLLGIIMGRVRFQCELCYEDITDLTREEKEEHLYIRHPDADWRPEKRTVAGIVTETVSKEEKNTVEDIFTDTFSKEEKLNHTVAGIFTDTDSKEEEYSEKHTEAEIFTDTFNKKEKRTVAGIFTNSVIKGNGDMYGPRESKVQQLGLDSGLMDLDLNPKALSSRVNENYEFKDSTKEGFKKETKNIRPKFPCDTCKQVLQTEKALKRHRYNIHNKGIPVPLKAKQYICENNRCSQKFSLRRMLTEHMVSDHGIGSSCSQCGKQCSSRSELKRHVVKHINVKAFECVQCNKKFKRESGLQLHVKGHQGIKDYKCNDCDAVYISAPALRLHRMAKHSGGRIFKCSECGKGFNYQSALDNHIRLHTGEKKYQCRHCDKRFRMFQNRKKHERVHRGIKEYQCTQCSQMFMRKDQLRSHMKRHLNQRDHVCQVCGKGFFEPAGVRRHKCSGKAD